MLQPVQKEGAIWQVGEAVVEGVVGEQFLGWFLEEQREEVASMSALLAVVDRAGTDNLLLVEDYLARTVVSVAAPSRPAPPAAGGAL